MMQKAKITIDLKNESSLIQPGLAIYLISTVSKENIYNIAPYGMVMCASYKPLIYIVVSDKDRDTYRNIEQTNEFVLNLADSTLLEEIDITAERFPPEVDEFKVANLTPIKSLKVTPPSIEECKVNIECKKRDIIEITKNEVLIIAKVVAARVDKEAYKKDTLLQKSILDPIFAIRPNRGKVHYFSIGRFIGRR